MAVSPSPLFLKEPPDVILALAPNWVGDAAMCTPALRALHNRFPDAALVVAGRPAVCALLEGLSWIHRLVRVPPRPGLRRMRAVAASIKVVSRPDLAVVFPHSFRAALLARWTGARAILAYQRGGRRLLLTHPVPPHREQGKMTPIYTAFEYLRLVEPLGCVDDGAGLELGAGPEDVNVVRAWASGAGPLVGIAPGAAFGPSKRWPPERYAAVMTSLAERANARFILFTGPGEEATHAAILAQTRAPVLEPPGTPEGIAFLKAAMRSVDLLVCNDTGPRHVAVAFNKPVVCIMGPTSPRYTESPWETGRVLRVDVDCGPCQKPECTTDHRCMTRVEADAVVEAALAFLGAGERQA